MPRLNVFSPRQPDGPFQSDASDGWSLPLGSLAGIQLYVSYSVLVALAVLAGLVAMLQNRPGNTDLPMTAFVAVGIWALGWLVQVSVHLVFHFFFGIRSQTITVSLLGVESPNRLWDSVQWTAAMTVVVASSTLAAVFLCGLGFFAIHATANSAWTLSEVVTLLKTPGFGLGASETLWLAGTWLCWVQVLCQLFPLPRSQGRGLLTAVSALVAAETDDAYQMKLARGVLQVVVFTTLLLAMATMAVDQQIAFPRWPLLVLLAVLLWISCRSGDIRDSIVSYRLAAGGDPFTIPDQQEPEGYKLEEQDPGWAAQITESIRMRKKRKRAQLARDREHGEAADQNRLDDVLRLVGEVGIEGLDEDDRALLRRVSDHLRREREVEDEQSS